MVGTPNYRKDPSNSIYRNYQNPKALQRGTWGGGVATTQHGQKGWCGTILSLQRQLQFAQQLFEGGDVLLLCPKYYFDELWAKITLKVLYIKPIGIPVRPVGQLANTLGRRVHQSLWLYAWGLRVQHEECLQQPAWSLKGDSTVNPFLIRLVS